MEQNKAWLAHHGILGQKWGVRRFENKDGTLTAAGKKRYSTGIVSTQERKKPGHVMIDGSASNPRIKEPSGLKKDGVDSKPKISKDNVLTFNKPTFINKFERSSGKQKTKVLKEARKQDINKLSDEELRQYNQRLRLEREYADLTKGKINTGKKAAGRMMGRIAGEIVYDLGKRWIRSKIGF